MRRSDNLRVDEFGADHNEGISELQFESLKEALGEGINFVHAVETGLSADPTMLRGILELSNLTIISNSDSHSLSLNRLGREVTVLDLNRLTYREIIRSIRKNKIVKTVF